MRFPSQFKLGIGFLFSGWTLSLFLNSQLAIDYYKSVANNSITTAFALAVGKSSPALFQMEGFANYYSLVPVLICLATGFILASLFCWIIESFVYAIYSLVRYYFVNLPAILASFQSLFDALKRSPRPQGVLLKAVKGVVNSSLEAFGRNGLFCASKVFTILILVNLTVSYWPTLGERLASMHIATWFSPEHGFSYILTSVLGALFNI